MNLEKKEYNVEDFYTKGNRRCVLERVDWCVKEDQRKKTIERQEKLKGGRVERCVTG